ncbi:MAG: hypothetical protein ACR2OO_03815, partial [Thermomicrobiales bacterium]
AGRRLLAGGLVYLVAAIGFSVAFPLYCKARGENAAEIGLLVALAWIALFVFGIPITILGGRGLSRRLLPLGPLVAAFGLLLVV